MKIRLDFVTNSSSSSFVCEICGRTETYYDGLEDVDGCECQNGHEICTEHLLNPTREEMIERILSNTYYESDRGGEFQYAREELDKMDDDSLYNILLGRYGDEVDSILCPICQFEEYSTYDMMRYLYTKYKIPMEEAFEEIKKLNKRRKKLYDHEYIAYVVKKFDLDIGEIQASWRENYKDYSEFAETLERPR